MKYFFNTKYCSITRTLITLAIIREDNVAMYVGIKDSLDKVEDQWVKDNNVPVLDQAAITCYWRDRLSVQVMLAQFLAGDNNIQFIVDWPDHIAYLSELMVTGPGKMIDIPGMRFEVIRADAYPTEVTPAIRHNAFWDAMAFKQKIQFPEGMKQAELLQIQDEMFKYNPVDGEELGPNLLNGHEMRKQWPDVPWYRNPWTGKFRSPSAMNDDPFGEKIKYGDDNE